MNDLRSVSCDIMTIGQYLQPYEKRLPVERYVTPEEFAEWKKIGDGDGLQTRRIVAADAESRITQTSSQSGKRLGAV